MMEYVVWTPRLARGPHHILHRASTAQKLLVLCGKMRGAHFPTQHKESSERRRREPVLVMASRQILRALRQYCDQNPRSPQSSSLKHLQESPSSSKRFIPCAWLMSASSSPSFLLASA